MVSKSGVDATDRKLLDLLQADSRLTATEIGDRLHLSPSAITRRIQRLRVNGSIGAEVIVVGGRLRDNRVTAIINIQLDRHQPAQIDEFRRSLRLAREVQVCVDVTGSADMLLIVSVQHMDAFNEFADKMAATPIVRRYETNFVKRTTKFTTAVPLAAD